VVNDRIGVNFAAGPKPLTSEDVCMRTIRLNDNAPARRLPFGSSEWAAESCLAEWSQFEREWLGPDPRPRAHGPKGAKGRRKAREPLSPLEAALAGVAVGTLMMVCWSLLSTLALH
jgi:hypothetical protein